MQEIKYAMVDGKCKTLCPHEQRDENIEVRFNVGSVGCKCDCPHFEGIRKSQNVVYCNFKKESNDIPVNGLMKVYIDFGKNHIKKIGNTLFDEQCIAAIECYNVEEGLWRAKQLFGKWSMTYPEKDITPEFLSSFSRGIINITIDNTIIQEEL